MTGDTSENAHTEPVNLPSAFTAPDADGATIAHASGDGAALDPQQETTLWTGRTDWRHYIRDIVLGAVGIVVGWLVVIRLADGATAFWTGTIVMMAIVFLIGGWTAIRVLRRRYRLTGQRLFIEKGILSQTIDQAELIRVDDVRIRKKVSDRFFRLGTIEILTTDATDKNILIEGVRDPDTIAEHVRLRMRTLRSRSLFVENL